MSGIANLYNVPSTPEEWSSWSFAHAAHHHDIIRVIYQGIGFDLPEFVLDPFDPRRPDIWLNNHQNMHFDMDAILGISPFSLQSVSFQNEQETAAWILLNAKEHYEAANILGIG